MHDVKSEFPSGRSKKKKMSKKGANKQRYAICKNRVNEDSSVENQIVAYPGRFHPWHNGHKKVYDSLVRKFGANNVYIVTSNKQAPVSSPFTFEEKSKLMQQTGVPADKIVQVKNPYSPAELTSKVDPNSTSLIFALSNKDADRFSFTKKDGSASYMQPYSNGKLNPLSQTGYVLLVPTVTFNIAGQKVNSASDIRGMYINANNRARIQILKDLYGKATKSMKALFDRQLGITETIIKIMTGTVQINESNRLKYATILAKARILESRIL